MYNEKEKDFLLWNEIDLEENNQFKINQNITYSRGSLRRVCIMKKINLNWYRINLEKKTNQSKKLLKIITIQVVYQNDFV